MDKFEKNLREALREPAPPALLAEKVMARVAALQEERRLSQPRAVRPAGWGRQRYALLLGAAAVFAVAVLSVTVLKNAMGRAYAVVEATDGGLYRVSGGEAMRVGYKIGAGESVRTNGGPGAVLALADGSRLEMRSKSELAVERAAAGIRIRLNKGSVIVNAAKQRTGHLYVQTKDVTVSVVGTVFLVNAEEEGSRVAVIEGAVRVQRGAKEEKLLPGEQVATNPKMESVPVREAIAWSRHAETHLAHLAQNPPEERLAFEVTSVRPRNSASGGGGGRGGPVPGSPFGSCTGRAQFDPSRFSFQNATVYALIAWAYGPDSCLLVNVSERISGGPPWIKLDPFDIEATIPAGASTFTSGRFGMDRPPKLQMMLRTLLADRFKLAVHRETREAPVYALTVAKGGLKLQRSTDASCVSPDDVSMERGSACGASAINIASPDQAVMRTFKMSLDEFSKLLILGLDRPVINKTEIAGGFDIVLEFAPDRGLLQTFPVGAGIAATGPIAIRANPIPPSGSSIFTALQEQLGLKLEPATGPVEVLVIDHVEKPTEN